MPSIFSQAGVSRREYWVSSVGCEAEERFMGWPNFIGGDFGKEKNKCFCTSMY